MYKSLKRFTHIKYDIAPFFVKYVKKIRVKYVKIIRVKINNTCKGKKIRVNYV